MISSTFVRFNRLRSGLLVSMLVGVASMLAQAPAGYYDAVEGKRSGELKTTLYTLIKEGVRLPYGSGAGGTWSGFEKTDLHPNGYVWDMYSWNERTFPGNGTAPNGMNIEHSVASSWWGGTNNDAYKDLYHLNPSDIEANSKRSNFPMGIVTTPSWSNGSIKVGKNSSDVAYTGDAFEPHDEYKGDFARAYLYMFTCYESFSWTGTNAPTMIKGGESWPMLHPWAQKLLVDWCRQDPVSPKEQQRAEEIYKLQLNRNPFIDYPELVEYIWGNQVGEPFTLNSSEPAIRYPYQNSTLTLPSVHYTSSSLMSFELKGRNLEGGAISLQLSGESASRFEVTPTSVSASEVNSGVTIQVRYSPLIAGSEVVTLTVAGANLQQSQVINLRGEATDNFDVLPATEVSSNSFVANWTPSSLASDYELSLYEKVVEGEGSYTLLLNSNLSALPEGWSATGFAQVESGQFRMASNNNDGRISSPVYDLSAPSILTLSGMRFGSDANARIFVQVDGVLMGNFHLGAAVQRFEMEIPAQSNESVIEVYAVKGGRVYMSELKIETGGQKVTYPMVAGYPVHTGLVTSMRLADLTPETTYFYTVSTVATPSVLSTPMTVTTEMATSAPAEEFASTRVWGGEGRVYAEAIPEGATLRLFDLTGQLLIEKRGCSVNEQFAVNRQGLFLVELQGATGRILIKIAL